MADLRRAAKQRLESLQRAGVTHVGKSSGRRGAAGAAPPVSQPQAEEPPVETRAAPACPIDPSPTVRGGAEEKRLPLVAAVQAPVPPSERPAVLADWAKKVAACTRCKELAATRTQTVFGVGNPEARLVFVGEAPGADEDAQGEPFVGAAGQLLNKILAACGLKREEVYILNILRCRPPGNRTPLPAEAANCREYLDAQLAIIRPEFICCLGACAAQNLLQTDIAIGKLRGKFYDLNGIKVICTWHPAYLMRTPSAKKQTWEDMQTLMKAMGHEIPARKNVE